ncbi:hypothetical protein MHA02_38900 [Methylobacterium haplocladii]|uniref:TniQ domain-containing protein n=1 Tax=Methylobacterium haplocladii TaxID=1176176 RepID=A0A512IUY9_9HYPH|nr:hypothetical protein MHA02_38900 [Methylobacterium haplocladii]
MRVGAPAGCEPAYSFLERLAAGNGSSVECLARDYGLSARAIGIGDRTEVGRLAAVACVDESALCKGTPSYDRTFDWTLGAETFGKQFLERARPVVCWHCIRNDRIADAAGKDSGVRRRVWWDLLALHRCPLHRIRLHKPRFDGGLEKECPEPLLDEEDCAWEAYVLGRLGFAERVDSDLLDCLSFESACEIVATCGAVSTHGTGHRARIKHLIGNAPLLRTGFQSARSRTDFLKLLDRLWKNAEEPVKGWSLPKVFGSIYTTIDYRKDDSLEPVACTLRQFVAENVPRARIRMTLGRRGLDSTVVPGWYSDAELDVNPRRMSRVGRSLGLLGPEHDMKADGVPEEVATKIVGMLKSTIDAKELKKSLQVSEKQLRLIMRAGLIEPIHVFQGAQSNKHLFSKNLPNRFLESLMGDAPILKRAQDDWQTIFAASTRGTCLTALLKALQDGTLRAKCRLKDVSGIPAILISRADVQALRLSLGRVYDCITKDEFGARIDLHPHTVGSFINRGIIKPHVKEQSKKIWITEEEFRKFDANFVLGSKLGKFMGISNKMLGAALKKEHGIIAVMLPDNNVTTLYRRADLLKAGLPMPSVYTG